jgi:hypothetical protein
MSWTKNVFSSHIETVGFNDETGELEVTWKNGRVSAYEGVDEGTALALANALSVGTMLHEEIKPNFRHRYIR